jgi:hypothetical protein
MSKLATRRGGARRGAGRKPKPLIALVEAGTFSVTRHGRLLWTDDSLLEAAADRPGDAGLQRLAAINKSARDRGGSRHSVTWFARVLRDLKNEEAKSVEESHRIEITEEWKDGVLHVEARTGEGPEPAVAIQLAANRLCPHCLSTVLRGVLERHESGGSSQSHLSAPPGPSSA